jgi:hypothetical protein
MEWRAETVVLSELSVESLSGRVEGGGEPFYNQIMMNGTGIMEA